MDRQPIRDPDKLTPTQRRIVEFAQQGGGSLFAYGLAGTGKSTALTARLAALLAQGQRPDEILVLVPQRSWAQRYERVLYDLDAPTRGGMDVITFYGFAYRELGLFWPLVAEEAGFAHADREPTYLNVETSQYFMWRVIEPLVWNEGYFSDLVVRRGKLLLQLVDNLNKSAVVGFAHGEIYDRLRGAWTGSSEFLHRYEQAQVCIDRFRAHCLEHNLLDFSLLVQTYVQHLFPHPVYQRYLRGNYRHLLVDNLEENVPVAHDVIGAMIEQLDSTVLVYDRGGPYRIFLGADAITAWNLGQRCSEQLVVSEAVESTQHTLAFARSLQRALHLDVAEPEDAGQPASGVAETFAAEHWGEMIRWTAERVADLVENGVPAHEIAIIAPSVSEMMRFALEEELAQHGVALYLIRPSTPLREDPVIRALLTLVRLAHPQWQIRVQGELQMLTLDDVALALQTALAGLDPVRARRLARLAVPGLPTAGAVDIANAVAGTLTDLREGDEGERQSERVSKLWDELGDDLCQRYHRLYDWMVGYRQGAPLPLHVFLSRLFSQILSRSGYGFHADIERARSYGRLFESAQNFWEAVSGVGGTAGSDGAGAAETAEAATGERDVGEGHLEMLLNDIATAIYSVDIPEHAEDAVVVAPVYTYLTRDIRSRYQFWVDLGSDAWVTRPMQPLAHPYVLSREWPVGQPWQDVEETRAKRRNLARLVQGLAARCSGGIYLAHSRLSVGGEEQRGRLQRAAVQALSQLTRSEEMQPRMEGHA